MTSLPLLPWTLGILALLLLLILLKPRKRPANYPRGPPSLGILGSLPYLLPCLIRGPTRAFARFSQLGAKYGKIMAFDLAGRPTVVISDADALREAFSKDAFCGRPLIQPVLLNRDKSKRKRGLALNYGDSFKEVRRFIMSQLREFGLGGGQKSYLEALITQEIDETLELLRKQEGQSVSTKYLFNIPSFNVLWQMISSQRFAWSDPQVQELLSCFEQLNDASYQLVLILMFPQIAQSKFLSALTAKEVNYFGPKVLDYFNQFVEQRAKTLGLNPADQINTHEQKHPHEIRDFTDAFLHKIQTATQDEDANSSFFGQEGYENLIVVIRDLFVGGTETTSTTLSWALFYLALHPETQEKLQQEIDLVLQGRPPTLDDKSQMPYTEAVINETLRKSSCLPMGLFHWTTETSTVRNYTVPEGTLIFSNLYGIHHDEETWGDPFAFRPERFLQPLNHKAFLPFSVGKRSCPGEQLARQTMFLFITNIFRQFSIQLSDKVKRPQMEAKAASVSTPPPHFLKITSRVQFHFHPGDCPASQSGHQIIHAQTSS